jgi:hypothetical protein
MSARGGPSMATHHLNRVARDLAVEQSLDAAIEIDEVIQGRRSDAPALTELVSTLMGSLGSEQAAVKNILLSDSQLTSLYHGAALLSGRNYTSTVELSDAVDLLWTINSVGLHQLKPEQLSFVRDFCLGLNKELVAEAFSRTPEAPLSRSRHQKPVPANGN